MKMMIGACLLSLAAVSSAAAQPAGAAGTLQVAAADSKGAPLAGARVSYRRIVRNLTKVGGSVVPAPGEAVVQNGVLTDANGASAVANLPAGDYAICGAVPSLPYLDPCKWGTPPSVTISASASAAYTLVLAKGVFLKVRIDDPKGLLPGIKDGPLRAVNLIVGVNFRGGAFLGAENTGVDSAGRDYQMIVPTGETLRLWLFSRDVVLTDSGGKPVDAPGALIPFQAAAGVDQVFTFTVSGPAVPSK